MSRCERVEAKKKAVAEKNVLKQLDDELRLESIDEVDRKRVAESKEKMIEKAKEKMIEKANTKIIEEEAESMLRKI